MAKDKFIMVSLEENKAKTIANVLSNDTSRKILDYLAEKEDASETDISKKLKIPISTTHYNLQQLKKANLVEVKKFIWSDKGKKIELYQLAKKYIIIAPKASRLTASLKKALPLTIVSILAAGLIQVYTNLYRPLALQSQDFSKNLAESGAMEATKSLAADAAPETIQIINVQPNYALWFLIGALFAIVVYIIYNMWKK
ncbi:helix-turn-helix domain-containing protein [archaeon]|nr:helix-turn-helix domain-containing protein [archaeon]